MTFGLLIFVIMGLLFTALISFAVMPFFPALAGKRSDEPGLEPNKDPRQMAASFRQKAQERMVKGDFSSAKPLNLAEQIYVEGNAYIAPESKLKGFACNRAAVIGHDVKIGDWIDAHDKLEIGERCNVGRWAMSMGKLEIGNGSSFRQLVGFPIVTSGKRSHLPQKKKQESIAENAWFIGRLWVMIPQNTEVKEEIVSEKAVWVKQGAMLRKNLKSMHNIKLEEGVVVEGDLFAEGDIEIGPNCVILGHVIARGEVHLSSGTKIGDKKSVKSIEGTLGVSLEPDVQIYGSVATQGTGSVSNRRF